MFNKQSVFGVAKVVVAAGLAATLLSACVGVVAPTGGWVQGHYKPNGRWVPGHYTPGAVPGTTWVPGHTGRFGQWVPGHWQ